MVDDGSLGGIRKTFDRPDQVTHFEKGKFETVTLGGMTIGRATCQPGWKWSVDVTKYAQVDRAKK